MAMIVGAIIAAHIRNPKVSPIVRQQMSFTVLAMTVVMVVMANGAPALSGDLKEVLKVGGLVILFLLSSSMLSSVFSRPSAPRVG
jgi:hypothetical protein